jgi:hypothetical protein
MVRIKTIEIVRILDNRNNEKIKVKIAKGVKKRDVLNALCYSESCSIVHKKTKRVLDMDTDIWELINDDKTPRFYVLSH